MNRIAMQPIRFAMSGFTSQLLHRGERRKSNPSLLDVVVRSVQVVC